MNPREKYFGLKKPCSNCPFLRTTGHRFNFTEERIREILEAPSFQCHKTIDYSKKDDKNSPPEKNKKSPQCAGLMAVLTKSKRPNAIMRLGIVTGALNPEELDPENKCYKTTDEVYKANKTGKPPK